MKPVIGYAAVALCAAALCADGLPPAAAQQPAAAPPLQVMTDTPEYCVTLRDKLDQMQPTPPRPVPEEVRALEHEGRRLCDAGETRGGILRLRHALMLMMRASREPGAGE